MPKPTKQQLIEHKKFLQRQKVYENKYRKQFYRYLASINYAVAKFIEDTGIDNWQNVLQSKDITPVYKKLYNEVTINEAEYTYNKDIKPLGGNKDMIDDLVGILAPNSEGSLIYLWRSLLNDFIEIRIASRITMVNNTTRERIAFLIQKSIEEGLGAKETATRIRKDRGYNRNRSLAIARTETVTAANQGKYIAAESSPYEMQKKWMPTADDRTRLSHLQMNDTPFVDLEQNFNVANDDGFLEAGEYPCASTFSASNTVNCRCALTFQAKRGQNGRLIRK